jgi:hypothetical protein
MFINVHEYHTYDLQQHQKTTIQTISSKTHSPSTCPVRHARQVRYRAHVITTIYKAVSLQLHLNDSYFYFIICGEQFQKPADVSVI